MNPASNLILVGPTGAGKSCVGTRLAPHFGLRLLDLDQELARRAGATVNAIFAAEGEAGFRARERNLLAELLTDEGLLLCTGGGAVLAPGSRRLLRARGFVVHLHASPDTQLTRLADDRSRPLLARADREAVLRAMAMQRDPLYAEVADLSLDTDGLDIEEVAFGLIERLRHQWQRGAVA